MHDPYIWRQKLKNKIATKITTTITKKSQQKLKKGKTHDT
jgi:hypothetical protein